MRYRFPCSGYKGTCISEILSLGGPGVFQAHDVVDFAAEERVVLMYQTVLAEIIRASSNQTPEFIANVATHLATY